MHLWLDDCREAPEGWTHAKTVAEAIEHMKTGAVEMCSLDHDLGASDPTGATGYDFVRYMAENNLWPKMKPTVHSQNPVGRENMRAMIERYGPYFADESKREGN